MAITCEPYRDGHGVLFLCAPQEEWAGEGFCLCGWRCHSDDSIGDVFRQVEAHVADELSDRDARPRAVKGSN